MTNIPKFSRNFKKQCIILLLSLTMSFGFGVGAGTVDQFYSTQSGVERNEHRYTQPPLSLIEYNQIELGDSLKEVQFILGVGVEMSRSNDQSVYIWENADGSHIRAVFRNKILERIEQSELVSHVCIASSEESHQD